MVAAAATAAAVALVSLAAMSVRQPDPTVKGTQASDAPLDAQTLIHAAVACDLAAKAGQAYETSDVGARARYAAAVLLLDQAIIESARAAEGDTELVPLDAALQAAHTAGHEGEDARWEDALDTAQGECRIVLG